MTHHKNRALPTTAIFAALVPWAARRKIARRQFTLLSPLIFLASDLLPVTAYKGAGATYPRGTGVMRIPEIHGVGLQASHAHGAPSGHHSEVKKLPTLDCDHPDRGDHH